MKIGSVGCECCRVRGPCIIGSGEEEDACMRRQGWLVDDDTCLCPECAHETACAIALVFTAMLRSAAARAP